MNRLHQCKGAGRICAVSLLFQGVQLWNQRPTPGVLPAFVETGSGRHRLLHRLHSRLNGAPELRAPDNVNISFRFVEGESLLLHLDLRGFAVSTGSACFSRSLEASHVILAIGGDHERAHGSVRLTLGRFNTQQAVASLAGAIDEVVGELRRISPLGKGGDDEDPV